MFVGFELGTDEIDMNVQVCNSYKGAVSIDTVHPFDGQILQDEIALESLDPVVCFDFLLSKERSNVLVCFD